MPSAKSITIAMTAMAVSQANASRCQLNSSTALALTTTDAAQTTGAPAPSTATTAGATSNRQSTAPSDTATSSEATSHTATSSTVDSATLSKTTSTKTTSAAATSTTAACTTYDVLPYDYPDYICGLLQNDADDDLATLDDKSLDDCANACKEQPNCIGVSYSASTRECHLRASYRVAPRGGPLIYYGLTCFVCSHEGQRSRARARSPVDERGQGERYARASGGRGGRGGYRGSRGGRGGR